MSKATIWLGEYESLAGHEDSIDHKLDLEVASGQLLAAKHVDLQATEADFVVGLGQASGIERIDNGSGALHSRLAERFSRLPGEKGDEGQFEYVVVLRCGAGRERTQDAGAGD